MKIKEQVIYFLSDKKVKKSKLAEVKKTLKQFNQILIGGDLTIYNIAKIELIGDQSLRIKINKLIKK